MKSDQTKILVFHDSGSNVILLPERYVQMYTIPNSVHWEKGTLHGVGSLETLGTACLVLPLVTNDNDTHIFTYPSAVILKDNTGPIAITLSGPIMELRDINMHLTETI